jgi:hypothetical protein
MPGIKSELPINFDFNNPFPKTRVEEKAQVLRMSVVKARNTMVLVEGIFQNGSHAFRPKELLAILEAAPLIAAWMVEHGRLLGLCEDDIRGLRSIAKRFSERLSRNRKRFRRR